MIIRWFSFGALNLSNYVLWIPNRHCQIQTTKCVLSSSIHYMGFVEFSHSINVPGVPAMCQALCWASYGRANPVMEVTKDFPQGRVIPLGNDD